MATFVRTQEIEHDIGPSGSFGLRVTDGEVELRPGDAPIVRLRATFELRAEDDAEADELFDRVRFRASASPGLLEVSEPKPGASGGLGAIVRMLGIGGAVSGLRIEAEVPRRAEVRFDGVSAEVTVIGLNGSQRYRTVSGDIVLNEASGVVRVRSVSGDVTVRADRPLELEAGTVSGDLSVVAPRLGMVHVNTVSGDVELEGELASGREHRVETVSGDLRIGILGGLSLEVRGLSTDVASSLPHRTTGSRDQRRYVVGDGSAAMVFSSMSGDVTIAGARRIDVPKPSSPPAPPKAPAPPRPSASPDEQLQVLRALEAGEIDVDEAARRLGGS